MKIVKFTWFPLILLATAATLTSRGFADDTEAAVRSAIDRVNPSVVRIQIVGSPDRAGSVISRVTTGVVVSGNGEIVSSSFGFVGNNATVFVSTSQGKRHAAQVVATDHVRKLTLLKTSTTELAAPAWAEGQPLVGAWAIAAGRFYATEKPSAALGVISALNRVHGLAIQTDAKVSPVNYGGPLIDMDGRVTGVLVPLSPGNEATGVTAGVEWYDSGIGFAIPAADVLDSVRHLREGKDRQHGLLGISLTSRNPLSSDVIVKKVHADSPADQSGLQAGDQILSVNDRPMARLGLLQGALKSAWAGDTLRLEIERDGEQQSVEATLTDKLKIPARGWLGIVPLTTKRISSENSEEDDVATEDDTRPEIHVGILTASPAAAAGLPPVCVISKVDDHEINSMADLRNALRDLPEGASREFTFSTPETPEDSQTVSVTAAARPENLQEGMASEAAAMRAAASTDVQPEWTQSVLDLKEDRYAWIYGPEEKTSGVELGVVMILNDGKPVTEALVQQWQETCQQHHLVLAVVYHEQGLPADSVELLGSVMSEISGLGKIDSDRMALVTQESHAAFVTRLLLSPRIRLLREAVFIGCRPVTAGASLATVSQKNISLLLVPGEETAEEQALLKSLMTSLKDAGATVSVNEAAREQARLPGAIARWMLLEKVR